MNSRDTPAPGAFGRDLLLMVLAGGVAFAIYVPALSTGFSADDFFILGRVRDLGGLAAPLDYFRFSFFDFYRPLTFLSHAVDWELWGLDPRGFHLTSLGLHAINTMLVFALCRRLCGPGGALVGALLFGSHPASQEAVYWMAARFDLLTTGLILAALLLLAGSSTGARWIGVWVFFLALLAKETAVALPILVAGFDVVIHRHDWRTTGRRLLPLIVAIAAYVLLRNQAADLAAAGGRWMKLIVLVSALCAVLFGSWVAHARLRSVRVAGSPWLWAATLGLVLVALVTWSPTSGWMQQKLGFVAFVFYYLLNPVATVDPPISVFAPATLLYSLPGLLATVAVFYAIHRGRHWLVMHPPVLYGAIVTGAALIPVLSLTGSPRYLYLPAAGLALVVGYLFQISTRQWRRLATAVLAAFVAISSIQSVVVASRWRWSSAMVDDGLALMAAELEPCGTQDALLLTAPVGIRNTYPNFYYDAFHATGRCAPASLSAVLRVMRRDAEVRVEIGPAGVVDLHVPDYAGTFTASRDLRSFDLPVLVDARMTIDTAAGTLETWPDGRAQHFRLRRSGRAETARLFYYSAGALRSVARPNAVSER
jgi:hypothetical protein